MRKVMVECLADRTLAAILFDIDRRIVEHKSNKEEVIKALVKKEEHTVGIVDEDPYSPESRFFRQITSGTPALNTHGLKLYHLKERGNKLIVICPRLEDWVLRMCDELGVKPNKYGLPDAPKKLHKIINLNIFGFEKLLREIKERGHDIFSVFVSSIKSQF